MDDLGGGAPPSPGLGAPREGVVYLVRHGEVHNPNAVRYGRLPGYGLSTRGFEQARCAGLWLREHAAAPVGAVRSSPLLRARETAGVLRDELVPGAEVPVIDALTELASPFDGLSRRAPGLAYLRRVVSAVPDRFSSWERSTDAAARMYQVVRATAREAAQSGHSIVLVSHQAPIWLAGLAAVHGYGAAGTGWLARQSPWRFKGPTPAYASITELVFSPAASATGATPRVRYVDCAG